MNLPFSLPLTKRQQFEMGQRLLDTTKWLWYVLILYSGPALKPARCAKVLTPPKNPATVEAQAKFFQDFFSVQLSPYKIEFGHVCEDPNTWEQRYERKDYKNHRDMGKVRWGDKKGGYGEHYWDLNHAGHAGNHGDDSYDDGSYHDEGGNDTYEEPSEQSPSYSKEQYDPEAAINYEESGRAKRAHSKHQQRKENMEKQSRRTLKQTKNIEPPQSDTSEQSGESSEEEAYQKYANSNKATKKQEQTDNESDKQEPEQVREKNQVILVVGHKERETEEPTNYAPRQMEAKHYVPYEAGAGIRQHQHPERQVAAATNAPRLFLEPTTGHVVDRATGQAYVLQPLLIQNPNYR